jgi:enoyl-CoA hydratase
VIPSLSTIELEQAGAVLRAVIDRPGSDVNAVDGRLHDDLSALVSWLRDPPPSIRAVLLTGRGRAFSAGGDFAWFPDLADPVRRDHVRRTGKQLIWDLLDVEVPVVAALNGPAMGLAATLVLLCDAVFMADTATIGDPHVRVGIVAGDGGTAIWPLAVGPALAKRYLLTGDPISAADALRMGLVTHVVPPDDLDPEAMAFARRLADGAPLAVRFTKLSVNKWVKEALNVAFDVATAYEVVTMQSEDHAEAVSAIRERREPRFHGR